MLGLVLTALTPCSAPHLVPLLVAVRAQTFQSLQDVKFQAEHFQTVQLKGPGFWTRLSKISHFVVFGRWFSIPVKRVVFPAGGQRSLVDNVAAERAVEPVVLCDDECSLPPHRA